MDMEDVNHADCGSRQRLRAFTMLTLLRRGLFLLILFAGRFAEADTALYATSSTATKDQIHTANTIGNASPDDLWNIHFLNTIKSNPTSLSNFAYYQKSGGLGRPAEEQLKDLAEFAMLGTLSGETGAAAMAEQGYTLYGGVKAGVNLAQDVYRGPLIAFELSRPGVLGTPSALVAINDLDDLKAAAKKNSTLAEVLKKRGYLDEHDELTPSGKDLVQRNLILDNDVKEKIKSDGTFRATVTDQAKESVKTAEQKITNKAEAGSIPQKAKNPDRGTELIEVGQDVEANGALLYSVGRLTKDQTLQKVGQGTHALGQFCQAVGAYQKAQSEASLAIAASSGIGLAMVAFSMFQQSSQDDAMAAIFKELQKIEEELYKIENQINELKELTFEGFEGLNLKADYGISLQQQALNNDLRAIYSSIQRDSDANVKSERDFLSAVNLDFAYCTDPKGRTDLSILTRCFVDFKNLTDRLSTYALTTNSGPEMSDRDLFLYQVWALRNFRSSTDAISPFQSKTAANASDLISVFYRGLPKIFGMDGADRPPDMDLWLQATKNYAALSSSLQNLKLSPSELSGYGDAFDNPTTTWQTLIDQGNQFETFLTQGLYSAKAYANFSKVIEHDVAELSTLLAAGYQSTATLMKSEDWATPKDKKNPGTTHNASVVDHPCIAIDKDKKLIRGTADDVAHLLYDWTQQNMGLRLALAGKTYEAFIPNEYWVAQFLDQGKVDLCYKYRAIDKGTYTYLNLDFEIQGRFVKPDGSELLIAARDYKSPALNTKQNYENYHPLPLGPMGPTLFKLMTQTIPYFWTHAVPDRWGVEGPWQNLFYGPENQWVKGHQKDVFGEDVASVNAGRQLALTGVISKVKVLFPDPNTGETGMSGGDFAAYFGDGFASEIAQRLTNSLYSLYAHLNQLVMAADIQAVLSAGTSKCSKSLVDYNPSTLFALASNQVFVKDDAREKAITEVLASASTNLVKNCSSTNLKGVLLADTIEALKKAMNPEKAQAPTIH